MAEPEKAKPGCFSGFLRVLLCAGTGTSPPVHPSDHVTEPDEAELVHSNKDAIVDDIAATPGLVARLMGLDSLPNTSLVTKGTTPDSVPRSRSVNFVDYLLKFDLGQANYHRRVKTSASFREVPALVHRQQDHDLVVFHWDGNVIKEYESRCELEKLEMGLEELKQGKRQGKKQGSKNKEVVRERFGVKKERNQGKNKKISKLKNEPRRVPSSKHGKKVRNQSEDKDLSSVSSNSKSCGYRYGVDGSSSCSSSPLPNKQKKMSVEPSLTKKMRNRKSPKKIESDYNSENLSPISVLDINDYPFLDGTGPLTSKTKWKSSSLPSLSDGVEDSASNNKGCACANTDINTDAEYYSELMSKLHTLTEKDIRELDCTTKRMYEYEDFEEICLVFEHKILDLLLHELVNEVVEISCREFCHLSM